jgi:hypothetical protein
MASSVEMAVNTKEAEHHQGEKAKDAKDTEVNVWDTESDISKNPKSISWYVIFASALANFSDGYQNNLVSVILSILFTLKATPQLTQKSQSSNTNVIFKHTLGNTYTSAIQTRISNALLVGAVIGIVVLGYTCDIWSRRGGLWVTSSLVVVGSLMATLMFQVEGEGVGNMMWYMTIARGITGVGVGGEYPPSAAAALEGSNEVSFASQTQRNGGDVDRMRKLTRRHSITTTSEDPSKSSLQPSWPPPQHQSAQQSTSLPFSPPTTISSPLSTPSTPSQYFSRCSSHFSVSACATAFSSAATESPTSLHHIFWCSNVMAGDSSAPLQHFSSTILSIFPIAL